MKKLVSFSDFQKLGLDNEAMVDVKGGKAAVEGTTTGAGTACVPTSASASGCCAYSSDYVAPGVFNYSPTNGTMANSDVNVPC
jgi:hypothetical protein